MHKVFEITKEPVASLHALEVSSISKLSLSLSVTLPADSWIVEKRGQTNMVKRQPEGSIIETTSSPVDEYTLEDLQMFLEHLPIEGANLKNTLKVTPTGEVVFSIEITSPEGEILKEGEETSEIPTFEASTVTHSQYITEKGRRSAWVTQVLPR